VNEDGFEYKGRFYRWHCTDMGKDLMLIDRFAGVPIVEFFELVDDDAERGRAPILLSLIATSVRAGNPDWSVERVVRTVQDMNLSDVTFVNADEEEPTPPLPDTPPVTAPPTGEPSRSPSNGSSSSSTPPAGSTLETSSVTPQ